MIRSGSGCSQKGVSIYTDFHTDFHSVYWNCTAVPQNRYGGKKKTMHAPEWAGQNSRPDNFIISRLATPNEEPQSQAKNCILPLSPLDETSAVSSWDKERADCKEALASSVSVKCSTQLSYSRSLQISLQISGAIWTLLPEALLLVL